LIIFSTDIPDAAAHEMTDRSVFLPRSK